VTATPDLESTLERRIVMHERLAEALLTEASTADNSEVASVRATMANAHAALAVLSQMKLYRQGVLGS
jgi:hypothetical protein